MTGGAAAVAEDVTALATVMGDHEHAVNVLLVPEHDHTDERTTLAAPTPVFIERW